MAQAAFSSLSAARARPKATLADFDRRGRQALQERLGNRSPVLAAVVGALPCLLKASIGQGVNRASSDPGACRAGQPKAALFDNTLEREDLAAVVEQLLAPALCARIVGQDAGRACPGDLPPGFEGAAAVLDLSRLRGAQARVTGIRDRPGPEQPAKGLVMLAATRPERSEEFCDARISAYSVEIGRRAKRANTSRLGQVGDSSRTRRGLPASRLKACWN